MNSELPGDIMTAVPRHHAVPRDRHSRGIAQPEWAASGRHRDGSAAAPGHAVTPGAASAPPRPGRPGPRWPQWTGGTGPGAERPSPTLAVPRCICLVGMGVRRAARRRRAAYSAVHRPSQSIQPASGERTRSESGPVLHRDYPGAVRDCPGAVRDCPGARAVREDGEK